MAITNLASGGNMGLTQAAGKASASTLDAAKANQIKENTQTELGKIAAETDINKGKKAAGIDANF
jgi:hypothetical protein